eukprot:3689339-Pleurochrysis_carterae.AAC.1
MAALYRVNIEPLPFFLWIWFCCQDEVTFIFASNVRQVLDAALMPESGTQPEPSTGAARSVLAHFFRRSVRVAQ